MLASTHEQEVMFSEKKKHRANTNIKNSQKYLLVFATQGTECTSGTGNRVLYIAPKEVMTPFCFFIIIKYIIESDLYIISKPGNV